MAWRETWNNTGWYGTDHFWSETAEAVLDIRFWLGIILVPLVALACWILFLLLVSPKPGLSWLSFASTYSEWLAVFCFAQLAAPAIWIGIGVRHFSWDLADFIDCELRPNTPDFSYFLRGVILLVALTIVTYAVWYVIWGILAWKYEAPCPPFEYRGGFDAWRTFPAIACALGHTSSPSMWWTLQFSTPATVLIVAYFWFKDLRQQGKFAWLRGLVPGGRGAGDRSTLAAVLDGAGQFSTDIGDTVSKLVAFVKGGLWILVAAFVINLTWPPRDAFGWIIFGLGIVALGKGLSYIGPALKGDPKMKNQSPQGSRLARKEEGAEAARGGLDNSSSLDRRDLNY